MLFLKGPIQTVFTDVKKNRNIDLQNKEEIISEIVIIFIENWKYLVINIMWNFEVLLTLHLSLIFSVNNQLDEQNFCFETSLFHASTCFEHTCLEHVEA